MPIADPIELLCSVILFCAYGGVLLFVYVVFTQRETLGVPSSLYCSDYNLGEMEHEGYTLDGTVNLTGRPVLSSTTGKRKACIFILGKLLVSFALV